MGERVRAGGSDVRVKKVPCGKVLSVAGKAWEQEAPSSSFVSLTLQLSAAGPVSALIK